MLSQFPVISSEPLSFESLKDERCLLNSDNQLTLLGFFENTINSSPDPNVDGKAKQFLDDLVAFSLEENSGLDSETVARVTWKVVINIASCIPCRHYGHDVLVQIITLLGTAGDIWKDYPDFGLAMRGAWNQYPLFKPVDDDNAAYTPDEWIQLNSFVGRLAERFFPFGLWEMRVGLEGPPDEDDEEAPALITNMRILVAAEWVIQGGRWLLRQSLLNDLQEDTPNSNLWRAGPLFHGDKGFNLERWGFWKRRFMEVRRDALEPTQKQIDEALKIITELETEAGNAWRATQRMINDPYSA